MMQAFIYVSTQTNVLRATQMLQRCLRCTVLLFKLLLYIVIGCLALHLNVYALDHPFSTFMRAVKHACMILFNQCEHCS